VPPPKFMTFAAMSVGLIPILESTGTGSEIMKRIAAPMVGGICTLVYPAIYAVGRETALQQKINRNEIIASATSETSAREAMALARSPVRSRSFT
jgi:copper/silver efflux system protein